MNWAESKVWYGDLVTPLMGPNIRQPIPYSFSDTFQLAKLVLSTLLPNQIGDDQARS
jgi:hypothetical protein